MLGISGTSLGARLAPCITKLFTPDALLGADGVKLSTFKRHSSLLFGLPSWIEYGSSSSPMWVQTACGGGFGSVWR